MLWMGTTSDPVQASWEFRVYAETTEPGVDGDDDPNQELTTWTCGRSTGFWY